MPQVTGFLQRAAALAPTRPAVVSGDVVVDYRELALRVDRLAGRLQGIAFEEPIGVVTEHDPRTPEIYLGVMSSGNAVVPVSSRLPDEAIAKLAELSGMRLILVAPEARARIPALRQTCSGVMVTEVDSLLAGTALPGSAARLDPDTAMISFTSGTTGEPKGVVLTHTNLVVHGLTAAHTYEIRRENVHLNAMPMAHFAGASRIVLATVNAGTHVILPRFSAPEFLHNIERWKVTHAMVVPTMVQDLLNAEPERFDLHGLALIYGSMPMPMATALDVVGGADWKLINGYGLTESSALATALGPDAHRIAVATGDAELLSSVGHPVPGVELRIVDESGHDVSAGTVGQIALRGAKVSPGYFKSPEQTAQRFVDGWLMTGDLGRQINGNNLVLEGRVDDLIISGGVNIMPGEIEAVVGSIEGVSECAAFGVPSTRWGQEVHLAVVAKPGSEMSPEVVSDALRTRLDKFKVPKGIHFVDELPTTSLGKIKRKTLWQELGIPTQVGTSA